MSLLARSCAALALTALAAGVVTIAPAAVAAVPRDGASAFGTTNQQSGPFDHPVDTTGVETQPTSQTVRKPKRTTRGAAARAPKINSTGDSVGIPQPLSNPQRGPVFSCYHGCVSTPSVGTAIVPQG